MGLASATNVSPKGETDTSSTEGVAPGGLSCRVDPRPAGNMSSSSCGQTGRRPGREVGRGRGLQRAGVASKAGAQRRAVGRERAHGAGPRCRRQGSAGGTCTHGGRGRRGRAAPRGRGAPLRRRGALGRRRGGQALGRQRVEAGDGPLLPQAEQRHVGRAAGGGVAQVALGAAAAGLRLAGREAHGRRDRGAIMVCRAGSRPAVWRLTGAHRCRTCTAGRAAQGSRCSSPAKRQRSLCPGWCSQSSRR